MSYPLAIIFVFSIYTLWECSFNYITEKAACVVDKIKIENSHRGKWHDEHTVKLTVSSPTHPGIATRKLFINYPVSTDAIPEIMEYYAPGTGRQHQCRIRPRVGAIASVKGIAALCEPELAPTIIATIMAGILVICIGYHFVRLLVRKYCMRYHRCARAPAVYEQVELEQSIYDKPIYDKPIELD
jgi:hypothetical protein